LKCFEIGSLLLPVFFFVVQISLLEFLDLSQLNCLNESTAHTLKSILQDKKLNTSDSYCESDADEQLLLTITFNQAVKVRSIVLKSTVQDKAPKSVSCSWFIVSTTHAFKSCLKQIKLLINRPSIGFEDVENASDKEVAQILELKLADIQSEQPIPLRFVRFQKVNSLHVSRDTSFSSAFTKHG
jgi:hypothetical protein